MSLETQAVGQLFIEVGCEELPYRWGELARKALSENLLKLLGTLPHGGLRSWASPRRIAVAIEDVPLSRPRTERVVTGPPVDRAYVNGVPGPSAIGFAKARGLGPDDIFVQESPKGRVIAIRITEGGESTLDILSTGLEAAIRDIPFPKTLRWGVLPFRWGRPIHWICATLGGQRIPASMSGLDTVDTSKGNRWNPEPFKVTGADAWLAALLEKGVMADVAARKESIRSQLEATASGLGVSLDLADAKDLLDEVTDLVEWPVVIPGRLPESLMDLPPRLLKESMRVHQRIFPTRTERGELAPVFLAVSNNPHGDPAIIAAGNARVLNARFEDARFFFDEDRKKGLDAHGQKLERMQWVRGLGTMAEKQLRISQLAEVLAPSFGADPERCRMVGQLCKADLTTQMVGEFPELQGHMGRLYAAHQGMEPALALAIEEHYLPRFAGDSLPTTPEGRCLALCDRLDTLCGCFGIGLIPQGNADPQGLRRAAIGLIALLRDARVTLPAELLFATGLDSLGALVKKPGAEVQKELLEFLIARFRAQLLSEGRATDLVDAVLAAGGTELLALSDRVQALAELASTPEFGPLKATFKRVMGLTKDHTSTEYRPQEMQVDAEAALASAFESVRGQVEQAAASRDFSGALRLLSGLKAPVDALFDKVLVMDPDLAVRGNRLGLLRAIADLFRSIADFTRLSAEG